MTDYKDRPIIGYVEPPMWFIFVVAILIVCGAWGFLYWLFSFA